MSLNNYQAVKTAYLVKERLKLYVIIDSIQFFLLKAYKQAPVPPPPSSDVERTQQFRRPSI